MNYFNDSYVRLYDILIFGGWVSLYIYWALFLYWWIFCSHKDKHAASKKYYGLIFLFTALFFGVLISIFLPSPAYFGL